MTSDLLAGAAILIVEDEPLIALHLQSTLEMAGAEVVCTRAGDAAQVAQSRTFTAAVLDARPGSSEHRPVARLLRQGGVPFLFYSTQPPEDVTTVRGAPVILKPERPQELIAAVAMLIGRDLG